MKFNTAALKQRYRAKCEADGTKPTKIGLRLFMQQARAIGKINAKQQRGGLISLSDVKKAGMPVALRGEEKTR